MSDVVARQLRLKVVSVQKCRVHGVLCGRVKSLAVSMQTFVNHYSCCIPRTQLL